MFGGALVFAEKVHKGHGPVVQDRRADDRRTVTGENVTQEELGGAMTHATKSGVCTFVEPDDKACLDGRAGRASPLLVQPPLVVDATRRPSAEDPVGPADRPQVPLVLGGLVVPSPAVAPPPQPVAPTGSAVARAAAITRQAIRRVCTGTEPSAPAVAPQPGTQGAGATPTSARSCPFSRKIIR